MLGRYCNTDPEKLESPLEKELQRLWNGISSASTEKHNALFLSNRMHVLRKRHIGTQKFLFLLLSLALHRLWKVNLTSAVLMSFRKKKHVLHISGKDFKMSRLKALLQRSSYSSFWKEEIFRWCVKTFWRQSSLSILLLHFFFPAYIPTKIFDASWTSYLLCQLHTGWKFSAEI